MPVSENTQGMVVVFFFILSISLLGGFLHFRFES